MVREYAAQPGRWSATNRRATTKQATTRQVKPTPPVRKCATPCQLTVVASSGVPGGNPSAGSARNNPAPTRLSPYIASIRGAQVLPRPGTRTRRNPTVPAMTSTPVATRLLTWIQPRLPLASRLHACRVRSKPSRVSAWASDTAT